MNLTDLNTYAAKLTFSSSERLRTYRKISVMLTNRLGIDEILKELYNRESDDGRKPGELSAVVYDEWRKVIQNGGRFSDALKGWVPEMERMIIMSGERAGGLPDALLSVITVVEANKKIKGTVIRGLFYPAVLLSATVAYLFLFGLKVIPEFTRILDADRWGPLARSLYLMSEFVIHFGWILIVALAVGITLVVTSMGTWTGKGRIVADRLPPWSLYRLVVGSGFLISLSALLGGGGKILDALQLIGEHGNRYLRERIDGFLYGVHSGMNAGDAMARTGFDFPSKEIVADLGIYAKYSGDFGDAVDKVAREWLTDGLLQVEAVMKVLNGLAIATMALVLMWIVGGFFAIQQEIGQLTRSM